MTCQHCGDPFYSPQPHAKYCSRDCKNKASCLRYANRLRVQAKAGARRCACGCGEAVPWASKRAKYLDHLHRMRAANRAHYWRKKHGVERPRPVVTPRQPVKDFTAEQIEARWQRTQKPRWNPKARSVA